jgi:hypothetical protein
MKNYTIRVDDKYFSGESMATYSGTIGVGASGFMSMNADPGGLSIYDFSENNASVISGYSVCGYIEGILLRARRKLIPMPRKIEITEAI